MISSLLGDLVYLASNISIYCILTVSISKSLLLLPIIITAF